MQTKLQSLKETLTNIAIGYLVGVLSNVVVLPLFGYETNLSKSMGIAVFFTCISLVRSYIVRRWFNKRENT